LRLLTLADNLYIPYKFTINFKGGTVFGSTKKNDA